MNKDILYCINCNHLMRNWSYYREPKRDHHFCNKCKSHRYNTKWYSEKEWFNYVNTKEEIC